MLKQICCVFFAFFICACSFHTIQNPQPYSQNKLESKLRAIAKEWKKTPYVLGGVSKKGADCSGFTQSVFTQFHSPIARTTTKQFKGGVKISKKNLRTGDLLFFKTGRGPHGMHVGIYINNDKFIHLSTKGGVREASLNAAYWKKTYLGARRYPLNTFYTQR